MDLSHEETRVVSFSLCWLIRFEDLEGTLGARLIHTIHLVSLGN